MYFSGFVETSNVKDYVQNRNAYVNLGKGADFKKAVTDIDARLNGIEMTNAEPKKTNAIFVKMENESNDVEIMKYNCPSTSTASSTTSTGDNDRFLSQLSDIRQKYSNAIYELEKTKEMVTSLHNDKDRLLQTIEKSDKTVESLSSQNAALKLRIVAAEDEMNMLRHENDVWKDEKKQLESSIQSLQKEKMAIIKNEQLKSKEIVLLRKEAKVLQARIKQNASGTERNKRYFNQISAQTIDISYEVKDILAHRKKSNKREFFIRWKDTWEKESNLNCPKILKRYLKQHN